MMFLALMLLVALWLNVLIDVRRTSHPSRYALRIGPAVFTVLFFIVRARS